MTQRLYLLFLALIILLLSACGPSSQTMVIKPDNAAAQQAMEAEQSGNYLTAAQLYDELAQTTRGVEQAQYYLRAAHAHRQLNHFDKALASLTNLDKTLLGASQQLDVAILEADIAVSQSNAEQALVILDPFNLEDATSSQYKTALELKIRAYEITENWLEKANAHLALTELLSDAQSIDENQQALWQALTSLTPQALDLFNPGIAPSIDSGWFALAYTINNYLANPEALVVALEDWQRNYPNHPANPSLYESQLESGTRIPQQLENIAILLPGSGPYAAAANAIKQGIIAAHFSSQSSARLHFFAVETNKQSGFSNVLQQYQKAIDQNASLVIGPLDKEAVRILAEADELPIPVLALNRLANYQHANLFQFGLAPEDDAIAAANYATAQGYHRVIALAPKSAWGNRISSAFNQQWLDNGGVLLGSTHYNTSDSDFSSNITPLLSLEASKQRYRTLKQSLGVSLQFEPRRRQDIDFLFLVARPLKARQILPQLKFHRAGAIPVIATSHAYSGQENSRQDIDLNGLTINAIPWIFSSLALSDPAYIALQNQPSENFNRMIKLYALGVDAYRLIPELNGLSRSPSLLFFGATGQLSINEIGHISRQTPWAIFKQGKIEQLPSVSDTIIQ
ncbi:MAG: LppC family lipoprotein [Methylophaga sp.]|nr:MAG: LppC family lipoprotein [Methylophaga sp.]